MKARGAAVGNRRNKLAAEGKPVAPFAASPYKAPFDWRLRGDVATAFLKALRDTGVVEYACRAADVSGHTVYKWKRESDEFEACWDAALDAARGLVEGTAVLRALHGTKELKFTDSGKPIIDPRTGQPYEETKYHDQLLIRVLEAHIPERYARHKSTTINVFGDKLAARLNQLGVDSDAVLEAAFSFLEENPDVLLPEAQATVADDAGADDE